MMTKCDELILMWISESNNLVFKQFNHNKFLFHFNITYQMK